MPGSIPFFLTTPQFLNGSRMGWKNLKPGTVLRAVRKNQGLKKGEKVEVLGLIRVISVRREGLADITIEDVGREGFVFALQFILRLCHAQDRGARKLH